MNENKTPKFSNTNRFKIGRSQIKRIDDDAQREKSKLAYKQSIAEIKASIEYKEYKKRAKLLQNLDKSNKKVDKQTEYANVLQFINATTTMIKEDYKKLTIEQQNNMLYIIEIAKNYSTHVKVLKKYAEKNWEYAKDVVDLFNSRVEKINPEFVKYFNLETIVLMSL